MVTDAPTVTMHIGELADKTCLSLRTIRHYDEIGLLKASGRTDGGFRIYTQDDLSRLMLIRRMKPLGFSLEEMMDLLRIIDTLQSGGRGSDNPSVREELGEFVVQAVERRKKLHEQLQMADEFLDLLRRQ
jgi:MerR family copper efflux transcriptional regulator